MRFIDHYSRVFTKPKKAFEDLATDPASLYFGFLAVVIQAVVYTFVYLFLIFGGGEAFHPWLDIPADIYYRYNVFFLAPSMFMGWILAAGVAQLICRAFSGTGSFESTLAVLGFGIGVASWSTGLHDLVTSFLGAIGVIDQRSFEAALNSPTVWRALLWILMAVYLVWFIALFSAGLRAVHRLNRGQSVVVGIIAFLVYQGFFLIFNR
jgi:hypothetical protein